MSGLGPRELPKSGVETRKLPNEADLLKRSQDFLASARLRMMTEAGQHLRESRQLLAEAMEIRELPEPQRSLKDFDRLIELATLATAHSSLSVAIREAARDMGAMQGDQLG